MSDRRLTFPALVVAALTYALSQTALQPALPQIERELGTGTTGTTAVVSAFFVAAAVATPLMGRLGDLLGKRRVLLVVLGLFVLGAGVSALADALVPLVAGRTLMGASAAIFPLSFALLRDELPAAEVPARVAGLGAVVGVGAAVGMAGGGLVADALGYRGIFWIALGIGLVALVGVATQVPAGARGRAGHVDVGGAALMASGLVGVLVAISVVPLWGLGDPRTLGPGAAGAGLLALFVVHALRSQVPLVDVRALAARGPALANAATFCLGVGLFGVPVVIAQLAQVPQESGWGLGMSATAAGLLLAPSALLMVAIAPVAGRLSARRGPRATLLASAAGAAVALVLLALAHASRLELHLWPMLLFAGTGLSLAAMPLLSLQAAAPERSGEATGINQMLRNIGSAVGIQVASALIAGAGLRGGHPVEAGYTRAFLAEALACCIAAALCLAIPRTARPVRGRGAGRGPGALDE